MRSSQPRECGSSSPAAALAAAVREFDGTHAITSATQSIGSSSEREIYLARARHGGHPWFVQTDDPRELLTALRNGRE